MDKLETRNLGRLDPSSPYGQAWEALVKADAHSGVMQSLFWAGFKRRQGLESLHLGLFENEKLIGGSLIYTMPKSKGAGILVAPEGPVLPWHDGDKSVHGLRLLIDAAEKEASTHEAMALRVEPRLTGPTPEALHAFGRAPVNLIPRDTMYLDLTPGEEEILARMKPKGRYNIRLSQRHGVEVHESNEPDAVKRFYPIMLEAARRDRFFVEPKLFFDDLAQALCPDRICRFFFAEHEGQTLATVLLITYGGRATYLYGGISNEKRNLMAGYAVQWAAMQAAKKSGAKTYDFYGYDKFGSPQHGYSRFSKFKSQFNGEPMRFIGGHDYFFLDRLADLVIRAVNEVSESESLKDNSAFTMCR